MLLIKSGTGKLLLHKEIIITSGPSADFKCTDTLTRS